MTLAQKLDAWIVGDRWIAQDGEQKAWTGKSTLAAVRESGLKLYDFTRSDGSASVQPLDMAIIGEVFGEYPLQPDTLMPALGDGAVSAKQLIILGRLTARALKEK